MLVKVHYIHVFPYLRMRYNGALIIYDKEGSEQIQKSCALEICKIKTETRAVRFVYKYASSFLRNVIILFYVHVIFLFLGDLI